jgi:hypothetical protein
MSQLLDRVALLLIVICRLIEGRNVTLCKVGFPLILSSLETDLTCDNAEPLAGVSGIRFSSGMGLFVTAFRRAVGLTHPSAI